MSLFHYNSATQRHLSDQDWSLAPKLNLLLWRSSFMQAIKPACQCRRYKRCGFDPWVRKISWRRSWQPIPVFLPRESPWTEEPEGLQSIGLNRVRQDWSDLTCMHALNLKIILKKSFCFLWCWIFPFKKKWYASISLICNLSGKISSSIHIDLKYFWISYA